MRVKLHSFPIHDQQECQRSLNIAMSTYPNTLEPLLGPNLESILLEMEEKFPPVNPHPKEEIGTIMYKAGQRSVIEWLQHRLKED
mgnify:CR=1 FL=1|tara:strand:- start:453 stop:707 length:255 start_codon:yes stop_codon:yes gene_type:complete